MRERSVYLSGMAGTGKTTVAKDISRLTGLPYLPEFIHALPTWVRDVTPDSSINERIKAQRWALYEHRLKNNKLRDRNAIVDRFWPDVLIYAQYLDIYNPVYQLVTKTNWVEGGCVCLVVDPGVALERLVARYGNIDKKRWKDFLVSTRRATLTIAKQLDLSVIDTTDMSVAEVTRRILHA